jgi:hypothetical protein
MRTLLLIPLLTAVALAADDRVAGPGEAACGPGGVTATVSFKYDPDAAGKIAGAYAVLTLAPPLAFPEGAGSDARGRVTSLQPSEIKVAAPKRDADGRVRVAVTTTEPGIPPHDAFTIRLDCPAGKTVRADGIGCTTAEVVDSSGLPMPEVLSKSVGCAATRIEAAK